MARPVGRPAKLTAEQVARAAFDLVDAEGPAALTMPRLARDLGVGTMTLYGYAASKEELVGMLPDLLLADLPTPDPEEPWSTTVETVFVAAFRRMVAHRHVTQLVAQSPAFGDAQARLVVQLVDCLRAQGFTLDAAFRLQRTVGTYTLGFAVFTIAGERPHSHFPGDAIGTLVAAPGDEEQFLDGLRTILAGARV